MPSQRGTGEIAAVEPGSLADSAGLRPGDRVLAVNGHPLHDQLDYRFHIAEDLVELKVIHAGADGFVEFAKHPDEPLGIEFSEAAFDGTTICNNNCFFCFLKGLPKGLRRTLYVKDDDYRLSFEHGNFVTLTNLTEADWRRLAEQRLSPLNLSVHATDLALRRRLLGNPRAPDVRAQLRRLQGIRIEVHTQVVLCPGVNDGPALDQTLGDLLEHDNVRSVAVVPVGSSLEGERRIQQAGLRACSPAEARAVLRQVRRRQRQALISRGRPTVYASDEFYLCAGARIPAAKRYDGFAQWENGVGMVRTLLDDWTATRRRIKRGTLPPPQRRHVSIACGTLIAPILERLAAEAAALLDVRIDVIPVHNTLFGERVNVSGLLPGQDYIGQLRQHEPALGERLFLPRASLDYFGRHFLDDVTPADLSAALQRPLGFAYGLSEIVDWLGAPQNDPRPQRPARSNGRAWAIGGPESAG